jgi:VanZ family protein
MARPYALLAFLWALAILIASSAPLQPRVCALFPHEDKLLHFLEFALLAAMVYKSFMHSSKMCIAWQAAVLTLLIVVPYGAALELYQWCIPYRECSLLDFLANCAGAVCAVFLAKGSDGQRKSQA